MRRLTLTASVMLTLAAFSPAYAQGKSQAHKGGKAPNQNALAPPAVEVGGAGTGAPFAWVEDATLLPPGSMAISISIMRWSNADLSEVDVPIIGAAFGVSKRVQFSASVPRVAGTDGAPGALGTSFFSTKIAVYEDANRSLKVSASPTLELLSPDVADALGGGTSRTQFGLPVSGELDRGPLRMYASTGYFSSGTWFFGTGATLMVNPKFAVSAGLSRAWRGSELPDVPLGDRDRKEISGAVSYEATPRVSMFASVGRTFATLDENGAGATVGGGISFFLPAIGR